MALHHDDGAGGAHGFQQEDIARRPAELRWTGMVEAMIEADRESAGFMRAGQQACENGSVSWAYTELFFASRIPRDNEKGLADWDRCAIGQLEIVRSPVQSRECR